MKRQAFYFLVSFHSTYLTCVHQYRAWLWHNSDGGYAKLALDFLKPRRLLLFQERQLHKHADLAPRRRAEQVASIHKSLRSVLDQAKLDKQALHMNLCVHVPSVSIYA